MPKNDAQFEENLALLEIFTREVVEPLRVLQEKIKKRREKENWDLSTAERTLQREVGTDQFEDIDEQTIAQEKAAILEKLHEAETFATKHIALAPHISEALDNITDNGRALSASASPLYDRTYKASIESTLQKIRRKDFAGVNLPGRDAIAAFVVTQEKFIDQVKSLILKLTLYRRSAPPSDVIEEQEIIEDYLQTSQNVVDAYQDLELDTMHQQHWDKKPTEKVEKFIDICQSENFKKYTENQQKLSITERRLKEQVHVSERIQTLAAEPQKNIRHMPTSFRKIERVTKQPVYKHKIDELKKEAKAVYLQTRTIKHFQQWDLKPSMFSSKMDKKTAVLRSLLFLNMHSPIEAKKQGGGLKDEIEDINTYLKTVLLEAFPEMFKLDHAGNLTAIHNNEDIRTLIERALGLDLGPPIDPVKFDKEALAELALKTNASPLWAVLKSMKPVVTSEFSLHDKIEAYEVVTQLIENKKIGAEKTTHLGLNVAGAAAQLMLKNTLQTLPSDAIGSDENTTNGSAQTTEQTKIKETFKKMQARVRTWEKKKHAEAHSRIERATGRAGDVSSDLSDNLIKLVDSDFIKEKSKTSPDNIAANADERERTPVTRADRTASPALKEGEAELSQELSISAAKDVAETLRNDVLTPLRKLSRKLSLSTDEKRVVLEALTRAKQLVSKNPEFLTTIQAIGESIQEGLRRNAPVPKDEVYEAARDKVLHSIMDTPKQDKQILRARSDRSPWFQKQPAAPRSDYPHAVEEIFTTGDDFTKDMMLLQLMLPDLSENKALTKDERAFLESYSKLLTQVIDEYKKLSIFKLRDNAELSRDEMATKIANFYISDEFTHYSFMIQQLYAHQMTLKRISDKKMLQLDSQGKKTISTEGNQISRLGTEAIKTRITNFVATFEKFSKAYQKEKNEGTEHPVTHDIDTKIIDAMDHLKQLSDSANASIQVLGIPESVTTGGLSNAPSGSAKKPYMLHHMLKTFFSESPNDGFEQTIQKKRNLEMSVYLKIFLAAVYPDVFERTATGGLLVKASANQASDIYKALGGTDRPFELKDLDPANFDIKGLQALKDADKANPLWQVLAVLPATATLSPADNTRINEIFMEKLLAYKDALALIADGTLGEQDKRKLGLALANKLDNFVIKEQQKIPDNGIKTQVMKVQAVCKDIQDIIKKLETPSSIEQAQIVTRIMKPIDTTTSDIFQRFINEISAISVASSSAPLVLPRAPQQDDSNSDWSGSSPLLHPSRLPPLEQLQVEKNKKIGLPDQLCKREPRASTSTGAVAAPTPVGAALFDGRVDSILPQLLPDTFTTENLFKNMTDNGQKLLLEDTRKALGIHSGNSAYTKLNPENFDDEKINTLYTQDNAVTWLILYAMYCNTLNLSAKDKLDTYSGLINLVLTNEALALDRKTELALGFRAALLKELGVEAENYAEVLNELDNNISKLQQPPGSTAAFNSVKDRLQNILGEGSDNTPSYDEDGPGFTDDDNLTPS